MGDNWWYMFPLSMCMGALVGGITAWVLSAFTYEHIRHDVDAWMDALIQMHKRQMDFERQERIKDRGHMIYILSQLNLMRNGSGSNGEKQQGG